MDRKLEELWPSTTAEPQNELNEIVQAINTTFDAGRLEEAAKLIEDYTLAAWFGLPHERFAKILRDLVSSESTNSPVVIGMKTFLNPPEAGPTFNQEVLDSFSEENTARSQTFLSLAAMFGYRLQGHPVQALAQARALGSGATTLQPLFDSLNGWQLFATVQEGITALLAGDYSGAMRSFTAAHLHPPVPALAFLHRDAFASAALLQSIFGDQQQAQVFLQQSERYPQTGSWAEAGINVRQLLTRIMIVDYPINEKLAELEGLDLSVIGEMWPFYVIVLQFTLDAAGILAEAEQRFAMLDSLPFPRHDGEGLSGSVIPIVRASVAVRQGNVKQAHELVKRADPTIVSTQLFTATLHLHSGSLNTAIALTRKSATLARQFRQINLWRLGILSAAYLRSGAIEDCLAVLEQALQMPRGLTTEETIYFMADVNEFAAESFSEWSVSPHIPPNRLPKPASSARLLDDDLELLQFLHLGMGEGEIAKQLFLPIAQAQDQINQLLSNLGTKTIAGALLKAEQRGLI